MKTDVLFEKKENKLEITLSKDAEYAEIREKLKQILSTGSDTFTDVSGAITVKGRRLSDFEEAEIRNLLAEKTPLELKIEKPKQMGLATIDNIFNKDTTISLTKVYRGTIRSGQRLEFEGSVMILGDVNGGSEVIAEGNIVVLGTLRGFAHAGAKGNRSAFVAAESIAPTQLRIADVIMKHEITKNDMGYGYEIASIKMGEIGIEK